MGRCARASHSLQLDRTKPPIRDIVEDFERVYGPQPTPYVTEAHEANEPNALKTVEIVFDWSDLQICDVEMHGLQHRLGTPRWRQSMHLHKSGPADQGIARFGNAAHRREGFDQNQAMR